MDPRESGAKFSYEAFISYRHTERDRAWAEWLIEALEGYRVPKALQKKGLPPRLTKVFRDEDEMPASGDLNDQIQRALATSRFLIVVCSPYTPRSKWVEREIELFKELGRGDQVLALLTEGEPYDSFPTALLERHRVITKPDGTTEIVREDTEPLAADVRPRKGVSARATKQQALLRLVACILGVSYDTLRQRDYERRRRTFLAGAAAASVVVLAAGAGGFTYWDHYRPKAAYYSTLVWRWGVPQGLGPIDDETRRHRAESYKVTTVAGAVTEVRRENGSGNLQVAASVNDFRWVVRYRDDGKPDRVLVYDAGGALLREEILQRGSNPDRMVMTFERDNAPIAQQGVQRLYYETILASNRQGNDSGVPRGRAEITRHDLTFDRDGHTLVRIYQDPWGTPRPDAGGSYGETSSYTPEGLLQRSSQRDADGVEMTRNGVAAVVRTYDKQFRLVRESLHGTKDELVIGPDGYAETASRYDKWGNEIERTYLGLDGKPVLGIGGFARVAETFDDRGNIVAEAYFDVEGKPTLSEIKVARAVMKYDDRGNEIERANFGVNGEPALRNGNIHRWVDTYDENNRATSYAYFDANGKPARADIGVYHLDFKRNAQGKVVEVDYLGPDGKLMLNREGVARLTRTYDAQVNMISESYFGPDGQAIRLPRGGIARLERSYDIKRNMTSESYFDVDGKPMLTLDGFARHTYTYDARGNLSSTSYFGINNEPVLTAYGFARADGKYDERGNRVEASFFGVDDAPVLNREGCARFTYRYDARDNTLVTRCFGVDGKPALGDKGYSKLVNTFDARNNRTEVATFGIDERPILGSRGFARIVQVFDDHDRLVGARYFDEKGNEIPREVSVAAVKKGSQAEKLGLKVRDRLLQLDDRKLLTVNLTQALIKLAGFGVPHTLLIRRGKDESKVTIEPGELGVEMQLLAPDSEAADTAKTTATTSDGTEP